MNTKVINPQKYREYIETTKNPSLAMFKFIQKVKDQIAQMIQEGKTGLEEVSQQYQKGLEDKLQKEIEGIKLWLGAEIEKNVKENIFNGISQLKGEKGEKGDSIKGDKGDIGLRGEIGPRGATGLQGARGDRGLDGKNGKNGENGKTPILGIDYLTQKETENFMNQIVSMINLKPIMDELEKIKKEIEGLKTTKLGGRRTIHRGGIDFAYSETLGTGDGTTTQFNLAEIPYDDNALPFLFVGGGVRFKTDDWTRVGKTITFLSAPENGAVVRAPLYRKS